MTIPPPTGNGDLHSGIRVSRVWIRGFRCIDEIQLDLEPGTTYLVGENNSGKTSILFALWSALGSRRPLDQDLRRVADHTPETEASVDLLVVPAHDRQFSPELRQRLLHVQRDPSSGSETVGIRTQFLPSRESSILATRRFFLQPDSDGEWQGADAPRLPPDLMYHLEAHLLDASRDLVEELGNRGSIWGRVLADLQIEQHPAGGDGREDLERALAEVARRVRDASPAGRTRSASAPPGHLRLENAIGQSTRTTDHINALISARSRCASAISSTHPQAR